MNNRRRLVTAALVASVAAVGLRAYAGRRPIHARPSASPQASAETEVIGVSRDRATAIVRIRNTQDRNLLPRYRAIEVQSNRVIREWTLQARDGLEADVFFGRTAARAPSLLRPRRASTAATSRGTSTRSRTSRPTTTCASPPRKTARCSTSATTCGSPRATAATRARSRPPSLRTGPRSRPIDSASPSQEWSVDSTASSATTSCTSWTCATGAERRPPRASSTRDVWFEDLAWSADSRYVYLRMGAEHPEGGCFVRVLAQPPFAVERLTCVDQSERIDFVAYSPGNRVAVVHGFRVHPSGGAQHSLQWVDMGTGRVTATARYVGVLSTGGVNDRGALVAGTAGQRALLFDPTARTLRESAENVPVPIVFHDAAWLDDDRYVVGQAGAVRVVSLGQLRWTDRGWPGILAHRIAQTLRALATAPSMSGP
jgi:hypothetical protein